MREYKNNALEKDLLMKTCRLLSREQLKSINVVDLSVDVPVSMDLYFCIQINWLLY